MRYSSLPLLLAWSLASAQSADSDPFSLVPGWPSGLVGLNISQVTAAAVLGKQVLVAQRGEDPRAPFMLLFNTASGALEGSWSSNGSLASPHGVVAAGDGVHVWVSDISGASVDLYTAAGALVARTGTHGTPGSGTSPPQYSHVADAAPRKGGGLLIADGDGGANNRVALLSPDASAPGGAHWVWGVGGEGTGLGQFQSPHSVALQAGTDTAWVADRGNNRLQALDASTGAVRGVWDSACLAGGQPWGVRLDEKRARMLVADGLNGRVFVLNLTDAGSGAGNAPLGACSPATLLQTLDIGVPLKPHELAIDDLNGDLYVACVGTPTWVLKYAAA